MVIKLQKSNEVFMAKRIDDHSAWMGGMDSKTILPMGVKFKSESSAVGAGGLSQYEDTTEAIKKQQEMSIGKIKGHAMPAHVKE